VTELDAGLEPARGALEAYLRETWAEPDLTVGPFAPFGDGHSGFTYLTEISNSSRAGSRVLRLSPPGARLAGPADIGRQGRIMAALGAAGLPVPKILATDGRPVLDGRSFALMSRVHGVSWDTAADLSSHRHVAGEAVEFLRRLSRLAPDATGLGGEAPSTPVGELDRWAPLLDRSPDSLQEDGRALAGTLRDSAPPAPSTPTLVHGDYHYGNLLFRDGRVAAVVDWEIASLGSPLSDLGCLAVASLRRRYSPEPNPTGSVELAPGELVVMAGADETEAAWYIAAACFKYAAILGYNLGLHRRGKRIDPVYEELGATMHGLVTDGQAICSKGLDAL
jgi:aminoglycoside phosphotransferase (APT) family kinase protein